VNTVISFILIFGALVFFHELGHLYFAKRAGILCREFAIGFGPRIFKFTYNETLYTIRLLPLGGFVRMAGEDPETVEIKPGARIGLVVNEQDVVVKVVGNRFEKYPNIKLVEVEEIDLEHKLYIKGYEEDGEVLQSFSIDEKAVVVQDGQETQIAPYNRQFGSKTLWQRSLTILAGPLMNFVLAFVILVGIGFAQGVPVNKAEMGKVISGDPADVAGLQEGDKVLAIDGKSMNTWQDIRAYIEAKPETKITMTVERADKELQIDVVPAKHELPDGKTIGKVGMYEPIEKSFIGALKTGATQTYEFGKAIFIGVGQLITGKVSIDSLSGPVGIYNYTDQVANSGFFVLLKWAAFLSVNLGVMNLLPLPALDGGRLLFFVIEALRGKPIDRHKESMVHFIGFALLFLLMIVVTWNDIRKFFL
jgi:regulator of sigma E protease